jgi:hypothetical protein
MEVIDTSGSLVCRRCGHANDPRAFFCSQCGAPVGSRAGKPSGERPDFQQYRYYSDPGKQEYYFDGLPLISLLVTIFGFFMAGFFGPLVGVILAHVSLRRLNRRGDDRNRGLAIASLVIGYFLLIVGLLILIGFGVLVGTALFHEGWNGTGRIEL